MSKVFPVRIPRYAAGTAAALCAKKGVSPRALPYAELRRELLRRNVYLG